MKPRPKVYTISRDFILACAPRLEPFGSPTAFATLETLSQSSSRVSSLEWLTALNSVKPALNDPAKQAELIRMVETNDTDAFKPLIFGKRSIVSEFILEHTNVGVQVLLDIEPRVLSVYSRTGAKMCHHYNINEVPVQKIYEIIEKTFRKPIVLFMVKIYKNVPGADAIEAEVLRLKTEFCPADRLRQTPVIDNDQDFNIMVFH